MGKFYGQIIYDAENAVVGEQEFETEAEAKAYVKGVEDLKADLDMSDETWCSEYSTCIATEPAPDKEDDFGDEEEAE